MNQRYEIPKSYTSAQIQTGIVALIAVLLFLTTSRIVRLVDSFIPGGDGSLAFTIRFIALLVAVVSVIVTWTRTTRRRYYIDGSSIIIENTGSGGRSSQEIITPKRASKIQLTRSFFGQKFGYGNILIETDSYSHKGITELKDIVNPEAVIEQLRARL